MSAQNLVPNPNFETYSSCPTSISQLNLATPWVTPTIATPDYFNSCSNNIAVDVPTNFGGGGYQLPLNGNGYAGCYFKGPNNYREYIQVQLSSPLEAGICYNVGFFMNRMNQFCGVNQVGIYISDTAPTSLGDTELPVEPQIVGNGGFYSDTVAWVEISGLYPALGGEQYITIGNFKSDAETPFDPMCSNPPPFSYYYIDSVYVIASGVVDELPLELGPPIDACIETEIDGESGDVMYTWSDGSHGHTLTASTTDTYSLTITQGCAIGIDSVDVTILGSAPVNINPGFASICEGESYTVTLDPNAGDYLWNDGSTDNEYTITASGVYSVTLDDGCNLSSDNISVEVVPLPLPVNLGNDTLLCAGDEFEIALNPGMNTVEWQDGSSASIYSISDPGIYSVTISNACGEASDEIIVTGLQQPLIDLGPDTLVWCEGDVISYNFDPDLGDFTWSDNSFNPSFFISSSGVYSVTVTNACGSAQDMVTVYEAAQPNPGLDDTINLCANALPFTLSVQEDPIVDHVIWSTGETTKQISVSVPGEYAVTVSNVCHSNSDTVFLDIITAPILTLPVTDVLCVGDTLLLNASIPDASYLWQDGSTLSTFEVTGPGLYTVTVTNSCGVDQDSTLVTTFTLIDPPNLGPDLALCPGEQVTLFAHAANGTYHWNDNSSADTLLVTVPGTYSVTVQDQCATAADTIQITSNNSPPVVDLPSVLTLCQGQSISIDANVAGVSYLWSDGTTDPSLVVTVPGSYSVTISNTCGTDMDTVMIVDGGAMPVIDLGLDIQLCEGESQVIAPDLTGINTWLWQDGTTGPTFTVDTAGQITIEVSNACGSAFNTLNVSLLPGITSLNLGNDTALCSSEMLLLTVNIPNVTITWFDGSHNDQISIDQSGTYTAEIANVCGTSTDTLIVTPLPDIPQLSLGPDQSLCPGELINLNPGIPNVQYLWQDGSTSSSFSTTQAGTVILMISNACGSATDSLVIVESTDGPQLDLGPDVMACDGDTVTIHAGVSGVVYTWQDGSDNPFFLVTNNAQLSLHIANSCGEDNDTISVQFVAPPGPDLGPDTLLCDHEVLTLTSNVDQLTTSTWQDGSHATDYVINAAGTYSLQQSNICGAKTDSIAVSYKSSPMPFSLGPDVVICPGESVILHAPVTMDQLLWQDGSDSTMLLANADQVYALTISNECGTVHDEVNVVLNDCNAATTFFIPNIFSPNGDQVNDLFKVEFNDVADIISVEGDIFDRWGNHVFGSDQHPFTWDGKFNNDPLNPGVYVYRFTIVYSNGGNVVTKKVTGDVTLVK